jgi:hypothetical protein
MTAIADKLMQFFDRSMRNPHVLGTNDCMLDVADWLDFAGGMDVARDWRGHYASEEELDAILAPMGGFVAAMKTEAARIRLKETIAPRPGDVGIIEAVGKPMGAIMIMSRRWRVRSPRGFATVTATPIVAWGLPCRN